MKKIRLPRKIKKSFKKSSPENWESFLQDKRATLKREAHIDKIFTRNYNNVYKTFHKMLRHGK